MRRMVIWLIAINCAGAVTFAGLWFFSATIAPMGAMMRVTDLDRAGAIDAQKLAIFDTGLAASIRFQLPAWIAQREQSTCVFVSIIGLMVCVVNLLALIRGVILQERSTAKPPRPEPIVQINPDEIKEVKEIL